MGEATGTAGGVTAARVDGSARHAGGAQGGATPAGEDLAVKVLGELGEAERGGTLDEDVPEIVSALLRVASGAVGLVLPVGGIPRVSYACDVEAPWGVQSKALGLSWWWFRLPSPSWQGKFLEKRMVSTNDDVKVISSWGKGRTISSDFVGGQLVPFCRTRYFGDSVVAFTVIVWPWLVVF